MHILLQFRAYFGVARDTDRSIRGQEYLIHKEHIAVLSCCRLTQCNNTHCHYRKPHSDCIDKNHPHKPLCSIDHARCNCCHLVCRK